MLEVILYLGLLLRLAAAKAEMVSAIATSVMVVQVVALVQPMVERVEQARQIKAEPVAQQPLSKAAALVVAVRTQLAVTRTHQRVVLVAQASLQALRHHLLPALAAVVAVEQMHQRVVRVVQRPVVAVLAAQVTLLLQPEVSIQAAVAAVAVQKQERHQVQPQVVLASL